LAPLNAAERELFEEMVMPLLNRKASDWLACGLSCVQAFVRSHQVNPSMLPELIAGFTHGLLQSDPTAIIWAFKLAVCLLDKKLLLNTVVIEILEHLLAFPKFLDAPFRKYTEQFLDKIDVSQLEVSHSLIEALSNFVIASVQNWRDAEKAVIVCRKLLLLTEKLSFSLCFAWVKPIQIKLNQLRGNSHPETMARFGTELEQYVDRFVGLCAALPPSQSDLDSLYGAGFEFLMTMFKGTVRCRGPTSSWAMITTMSRAQTKIDPMPLLELARENFETLCNANPPHVNYPMFYLALFCSDFLPSNSLIQYRDLTERCFRYFLDSQHQIDHRFSCDSFVRRILSDPLLKDDFEQSLLGCFQSNPGDCRSERHFHLLHGIIKAANSLNKPDLLGPYWEAITSACTGAQDIMTARTIVEWISLLSPDQQKCYLSCCLDESSNVRNVMIEKGPFLLKSESVTNHVKLDYLNNLSRLLLERHDLPHLVKLVDVLPALPFDTIRHQVLLMFALARHDEARNRLIYADKIVEMLGVDEVSRFRGMTCCVPPSFWTNSALSLIVLLIADRQQAFYPLASLFELLSEIAAQFAAPLFVRLVPEAQDEVESLLIDIFKLRNSKDYTQLISALMSAFATHQITINTRLSYSAFKITNAKHLFSFQPEDLNNRMLMPNSLNDYTFGMIHRHCIIEHRAAAAHFFLSNFEESRRLFDAYPTSDPLLTRMSRIATRFANSEDVLDSIDHHDPFLYGYLARAKAQTLAGAAQVAPQTISLAERSCINFFKTHPHPTHYERERIAAAQFALQCCRYRTGDATNLPLPSLAFQCCLNPALQRFVNQFARDVNQLQLGDPAIKPSAEPQIVFARSLAPLFRSVASHTPHGLVSVALSEIHRVSESFSRPKATGPMAIRWADFLFTLFTADPNAGTLRPAILLYAQLWGQPAVDRPSTFKAAIESRLRAAFKMSQSDHRFRAVFDDMRGSNVDQIVAQKQAMEAQTETALVALFDALYSMDFQNYSEQDRLAEFLRRCLLTREVDLAGLDEFPNIRSRDSLVKNIRNVDDGDIDFLVGTLLPAAAPYGQVKAELAAKVTEVNRCLPMPLSKSRLLRIDGSSIRKLEGAFILRGSTHVLSSATFIIHRVPDSKLARTWGFALSNISDLTAWSYSSRRRPLRFGASPLVRVGDCYVLSEAGPTDVVALSQFETSANALSEYLSGRFDAAGYFRVRQNGIGSFGSLAVVRAAFAMPQPTAPSILFASASGTFLASTDFRIPAKFGETAVLLSAQLELWFGPTMRREMALAMAAMAQACVDGLEVFRALCEEVIVESARPEEATAESVLAVRDAVDDSVFQFVPPSALGAAPDESIKWIERIEQFIERSMREDVLLQEEDIREEVVMDDDAEAWEIFF
jgi:hypothetical protein